MSDLDDDLSAIRNQLDQIDEQLITLINQRAGLAMRIGEKKAAAGQHVYAPDRERQVLDRVARLNPGPMPTTALRHVYRELMSASLALERAPRIAILGPLGSYSHLAGRRRFGSSVEFETVSNITAVFAEVEHNHVEYGLAPVENSIGGGVGETLDALISRNVKICGELQLAVHHHLLGQCPLEDIEHVYSKPEVFTQCRRWLMETGLINKTVPVESTSAAAKRAATEPGAAAIASDLAAELFGVGRLAEFVEDDPGNVTRFLIIGTTEPKPTGSDKTSVVFSVGHQSGQLVEALDVLRRNKVNMTRIESRPDRNKKWSYHFFVDVEGHVQTASLAEVLDETAKRCDYWKMLGSYPRTDETV